MCSEIRPKNIVGGQRSGQSGRLLRIRLPIYTTKDESGNEAEPPIRAALGPANVRRAEISSQRVCSAA